MDKTTFFPYKEWVLFITILCESLKKSNKKDQFL